MNGKDKIEAVLNELNVKAPTLAAGVGLKYQRILDIQNGRTQKISGEVANAIVTTHPQFNINWLITGEGDMLKNAPTTTADGALYPAIIETQEDYSDAIGRGLKPIPEVDFKFSAGSIQLVGSDTITRYWSLPDCSDCEAVSQVSGNSMLPTFPPGCFVVLKRLSFSPDRVNEIPYGNTFGVVVEDRDTGEYNGYIKVLRRHKERNLAKEYIIAHSINDAEYDDFDIPIQQIRSLWVVKQHVVSDML